MLSARMNLSYGVPSVLSSVRRWWRSDHQRTRQASPSHECVVAHEELLARGLGASGRHTAIDFLSIDTEGFEPDVLRCWPFAALSVHAILLETHR